MTTTTRWIDRQPVALDLADDVAGRMRSGDFTRLNKAEAIALVQRIDRLDERVAALDAELAGRVEADLATARGRYLIRRPLGFHVGGDDYVGGSVTCCGVCGHVTFAIDENWADARR